MQSRLKSAWRRKHGGIGRARHVSAPGGVNGDAESLVEAVAAEQGRVGEDRVDDERLTPVVLADAKLDGVFRGKHKPAVDRLALPFQFLVDHRLVQPRRLTGSAEQEIAFRSELQLLHAFQAEADLLWVR